MKTKATTVWHKMWGVAVLVCVFTSLESRAQKAVEFFHTYLITQGEVITFSDSYVDNTKTAYLADILEPVAGNPKQFRFLGTTGWYCFQSFDVNPFLRGARLDWGTPNSDQYDDWKSDDIVNNNTVYNSHRFIEPTNPGTTLTDNGANGYEYIYVMPVNDEKNGVPSLDGTNVNFQTDDLSWFDSAHNGQYFGYGHIWLRGNNAFGFPSMWAWKGDRTFKGSLNGKSDNFVPMTQTEKNLYKITVKTGQQLNTKQSDYRFNFNAQALGGLMIAYKVHAAWEFAGISTDDNTAIDFIQLKVGGNFEGISKAEAEKNVAEKNSALPLLPLNYNLCFTIDLRNFDVAHNTTSLPLKLNITNRPRLAENADPASSCEVSLSGTLIDKSRNPLWADDGVNNYTLADALRFQAGVAYSDQVSTSYNSLKINGTLTESDLTYLKWLIDNGKIEEIDLSDARLPELEIPSNFVDATGKTKLTTIKLPHFLNKISANAFAGCTALANVEFTGTETGGCEIGEGAFKNCTALSGESIEQILKTTTEVKAGVFEGCLQTEESYEISIPANISSINDDAFKDCNINKVNVPAKYVAPTAKPFSVDRVGTPHNGPHNLSLTDGGTINIEAEDFNEGTSGVAYLFNHNSNLHRYYAYRNDMEGAPVWKVGKPSGHPCHSPEGETDKHLVIGDFEQGDWMNYTVNVPGDGGKYTLAFYVAKTGNDGAFSVYVDGEKIGSYASIGGDNDNCNESRSFTDVLLSKGQHVIQFYCDSKLNFDYFSTQRTSTDTSADSDDQGGSSAYDGKVPTVSASAFTTDANHLEIGFADVSEYDSEAERLQYVHEYKADAQWKALLTKDLYENSSTNIDASKNFDVCNQEFADVRLHRSFGSSTNWETLVLPFDVVAGTEGTASSYSNPEAVNTVENKIRYAAIYIGVNAGMLRFLNVGTHNADAASAAAEEGSASYRIPAGTPFIVYLDKSVSLSADATNGDYVTFVDVNLNGSQTVNNFQKGGYWFCGTFNAIAQHGVPVGGLWAMSNNNLTHAMQTAKFKGYRCWFQTAESAATQAALFPNNAVGAPGTSIIDVSPLAWKTVDGELSGLYPDTPSGICNIDGAPIEVVNKVYTLSGQRVVRPARGLYIVNGKKMIVK
ncbi:MAG: leucine-rich repeat protein [Prevotella sp.]|nr:leucine-rich repeat protein [Prevotella sp.]